MIRHQVVATLMLVMPLLWMTTRPMPTSAASHKSPPGQFSGNASWYGAAFNGRKTASGEIFNMNKLTAAHLRLPMPTKVLVENPRNGKVVVVRVNDRGPYAKNRIMDLSREGAKRLGTLSMGVAYIECLVLPAKEVVSPSTKATLPGTGDIK